MKNINIKFTSRKDLLEIQDEIKPFLPENVLIQVFAGIADLRIISEIQSFIKELFPGAAIIGASTSGEIIDSEIIEQSIVISISLFEKTKVKSVLINQNDDQAAAGRDVASALKTLAPRVIIAFGSGLKNGILRNDAAFLGAIYNELETTVIAGGLAASKNLPGRTFVFNEETITEEGYTTAALSGEALRINTSHNLGWKPIGKKMTVTSARGRQIFTIDDKSVKEIYKKYLGIEHNPQDPYNPLIEFPFIVEKNGIHITNPPLKENPDNSFFFLQPFTEGEQLRFSYLDIGLLESNAFKVRKEISDYQPESVFVYTCASRRRTLRERISFDTMSLKDSNSSAGFFTFGEYFSDRNNYPSSIQQTMTILMLSESKSVPSKESRHQPDIDLYSSELNSRELQLQKVLSHLVASTTEELEQKNTELADMARIDAMTGLANRRHFDESLSQELKRHSRTGTPLSLILLDVDYFKRFNDTYGHVAGDDCLRGIAQVLKKEVHRPADLSFRYGGEEFGCILPDTDNEGALRLGERIRTALEQREIPHKSSDVSAFVSISLGVLTTSCTRETAADELIKSCDSLLYTAKENGRNRIETLNLYIDN